MLLKNIADAEEYFGTLTPEDPFRDALTALIDGHRSGIEACNKVIDLGTRDTLGFAEPVVEVGVEVNRVYAGLMKRLFDKVKACGSRASNP